MIATLARRCFLAVAVAVGLAAVSAPLVFVAIAFTEQG